MQCTDDRSVSRLGWGTPLRLQCFFKTGRLRIMAQNVPRSMVARCLAAMALVGVYCFGIVGTSAVILAASTTSADAQRGRGRGGGWDRGRGRGRGYGYGRGRGFGFYGAPIVRPGCYFSRRWGRVVCPY
uniref:Uncharacterized protein n=1 Tax=Rhodopseudomonas palustris (strain BisA53) TaxID=316055 RepID=Q07RM5_RHOP5